MSLHVIVKRLGAIAALLEILLSTTVLLGSPVVPS